MHDVSWQLGFSSQLVADSSKSAADFCFFQMDTVYFLSRKYEI